MIYIWWFMHSFTWTSYERVNLEVSYKRHGLSVRVPDSLVHQAPPKRRSPGPSIFFLGSLMVNTETCTVIGSVHQDWDIPTSETSGWRGSYRISNKQAGRPNSLGHPKLVFHLFWHLPGSQSFLNIRLQLLLLFVPNSSLLCRLFVHKGVGSNMQLQQHVHWWTRFSPLWLIVIPFNPRTVLCVSSDFNGSFECMVSFF